MELSADFLSLGRGSVTHGKQGTKISDISVNISSKYRISICTDTILPIESRLAKKSVKSQIFWRNIESISQACMC